MGLKVGLSILALAMAINIIGPAAAASTTMSPFTQSVNSSMLPPLPPPVPGANNGSMPGPISLPGGAGGAGAPVRPMLPGGLTVSKDGVDMRSLKALDPSTVAGSVANMSQSEQDTVCLGVMNGGGNKALQSAMQAAGIDCFAAMSRDSSFKPDKSQAAAALKLKRESAAPSSWGTSDWETVFNQMPDAVSTSDLRQMPSNTLKSLVAGGNLQSSPDAFRDPSKARALESQLKTAYGQPGSWDNSTLREMGSLLGQMDVSTLKAIPASMMRDAASSFKDISFDDHSKRAAMGNLLIEGLGKGNANAWSSDDVANADQFIRSNPSIIGKLSDSAITGSLSDLGARETDARGASQLGKRLKSMSAYSDPTAIDSSKVSQMGQLMQGMGRDYLSKLPLSAISGALSTLSNVSFPRGDARELMAKVKGTPSNYTASSIKEFGTLITGLDKSDMDQIPASVLAESLSDIADKDFDQSQCRAIVTKVKTIGGSSMQNMGKLMEKCMTPADLDGVSIDDLGLNCSSSTAPSFNPDKATAKKLMAQIKQRFGDISSSNTNYTLTCMKNWGKIAALGMDASDIENLPDNGDLGSIFEKLSDYESDMDETQTKAVAKRVRTFLQMDNDTLVSTYDSTTIAQVGKFLKHFNDTDLNKFNSTVKPDIASNIGGATLDQMPKSEITRMKTFALQNVLRDDTSVVTDRTSESSYDDNDVRSLGNLFTGLETADINKLSSTAISSNMNTIQDKVRGLSSQKAVIERIASEDSTYFDSSDNIIACAGLVGGMDSSRMNALNQSVLGEALSDAATVMEARVTNDQKRDDAGFKSEVSDTEQTSLDDNKNAFVASAFTGYKAAESTSSRRRRRATTTITCSDIKVLGSNSLSLTTAQIATISNSDFTDCTETLGAITGWSSAQLSALATQAKTAYGAVTTWTAASVKLIGTMNAGLTSSEISTLAITSADTLAIMGTSASFSSTQLKAGFSRYLSQGRSNTASSVTGDDLITIGSFACGAETAQIDAFTNANYKSAAATIGQQTGCDASQLESYANQAKTAYGASNTWDSTSITTVGIDIGGLTASEISALTTTQIQSITTTTMAAIPASKFSAFSASQLASFSTSQANSVTSTQQNALSATQRASLLSAGASDLSTSSSAGSVRATVLFLLPLLAYLL